MNMWTANLSTNSVTKITPSGLMTNYVGTGAYPTGIAFDGVNMWTTNRLGNSVTKIAPTAGYLSGSFLSSPISIGSVSSWGTMSWVNTSATGTITMQVRSGSDVSMSDADTWSSSCNINSGDALATNPCIHSGDTYIQYQAILTPSAGNAATPVLGSVTINYNQIASLPTFSSLDITFDQISGISSASTSIGLFLLADQSKQSTISVFSTGLVSY